jgi:uncharacterized protein
MPGERLCRARRRLLIAGRIVRTQSSQVDDRIIRDNGCTIRRRDGFAGRGCSAAATRAWAWFVRPPPSTSTPCLARASSCSRASGASSDLHRGPPCGRSQGGHVALRSSGMAWQDHAACRTWRIRPHTAGMDFEWDEVKNRRNLAKHGISFEEAARVFAGPRFSEVDDRQAHGETRFRVYGMVEGRLLCVACTMRGERVRIISARRASRAERRTHRQIQP